MFNLIKNKVHYMNAIKMHTMELLLTYTLTMYKYTFMPGILLLSMYNIF